MLLIIEGLDIIYKLHRGVPIHLLEALFLKLNQLQEEGNTMRSSWRYDCERITGDVQLWVVWVIFEEGVLNLSSSSHHHGQLLLLDKLIEQSVIKFFFVDMRKLLYHVLLKNKNCFQ